MSSDELRREVVHYARTRIDDFQAEQKLIDALCRLPDNVRIFALEHCFFVAIGGDEGGFFVSPQSLTAGGASGGRWLVVLNSSWKLDHFQSAVAHEIAHLWLGHPEADLGTDVALHENEAAEQVRAWGFGGIGSLRYEDRP